MWPKRHESMVPSCFVSTTDIQAGGGLWVWEIFLAYLEHYYQMRILSIALVYVTILADHVHSLVATSIRITRHVTRLKIRSNWFLEPKYGGHLSSLYRNGLHRH